MELLEAAWKRGILPTAKTKFEIPPCNFLSSLFTSLLIIVDTVSEKETLSYIILQTPQCPNITRATFLPAVLCTFLQRLLL